MSNRHYIADNYSPFYIIIFWTVKFILQNNMWVRNSIIFILVIFYGNILLNWNSYTLVRKTKGPNMQGTLEEDKYDLWWINIYIFYYSYSILFK